MTPAPTEPLLQALARARQHGLNPNAAQDAQVLAALHRQLATVAHADAPVPRPVTKVAPVTARRPWLLLLAHPLARWGAAAMAVLLAAGVALFVLPAPKLAPEAGAVAARLDSGYLPIATAAQWQGTLAGQAQAPVWIVPTELPRERLAVLGLPFDASRADEDLRAELMLNQQGQVLAVRFVH